MAGIAQSVMQFIARFPALKDGKINLDYLGSNPIEYVVETIPCDPIVTRYMDGGSLRQFLFAFASRESYGTDTLQNIQNSEFYEDFSSWIEECDRNGMPPDLEDFRAQKIEVLTAGYLLEEGKQDARYQIQCRLTYMAD